MRNSTTLILLWLVTSTMLLGQGYWSKRFSQVGTNNNVPQSITVSSDGTVFIGGGFDYAFGVKTGFFARWNPQSGWDSLPGTFTGSSFPINSITTGNGNDIFVAGGFGGVGSLTKRGIVKWNGTKWDSVPGTFAMPNFTNPSKIVFANNVLYALGNFTRVGTLTNVGGVARWNGTAWETMGTIRYTNSNNSQNNRAFTVTADGRIYAATYSIDSWSKENVAIIKWNGAGWDTVAKDLTGDAGGVDGFSAKAHVNDIAVHGDTIYVAGAFSRAGNKIANCIAKWDGSKWDSLGAGTLTALSDIEIDSLGRVYAAGRTAPYEGNVSYGSISRWNGSKWERLGSGVTKSQYGGSPRIWEMKLVNSKLFLCGDFKEPGGIATTGAVMFDIAASRWVPLLGRNTNGFDDVVLAYHETNTGSIYVGGGFNFAGAAYARRLAQWNGKTWDSVGTGSFKNVSTVKALGSDDSVLYIGGGFTSFNGVNSTGVIKWNGKNFISMNGSGQPGSFSSDVRAITKFGPDIIIAGSFQSLFGTFPSGKTVHSIVKWTGTKYDSLDIGIRSGTSSGQINAVAVKNSVLYVAGNFTTAGNVAASSIAQWNGTAWSALNTDLIRYNKTASQAMVTAAVVVGNDLYIAGKFDSIGTKAMWHLAKWNGAQWDTVSLAFKNDFTGIVDMAADKNGRLYVVGNFTAVGGDNTKRYVARWNGAQWEKLGELTSNFSQQMSMAESDSKGNIYMSGYFGYVNGYSSQNFAAYINDPGGMESVRRIDALPDGFGLEQNYPNPFNPSTAIRFTVNTGGVTSLKVYDVIGREVATLVNGPLAPGTYDARFDGSVHSSGIYLYRLQSGNSTVTKKMLLVK